jgi:hypothetical protein
MRRFGRPYIREGERVGALSPGEGSGADLTYKRKRYHNGTI